MHALHKYDRHGNRERFSYANHVHRGCEQAGYTSQVISTIFQDAISFSLLVYSQLLTRHRKNQSPLQPCTVQVRQAGLHTCFIWQQAQYSTSQPHLIPTGILCVTKRMEICQGTSSVCPQFQQEGNAKPALHGPCCANDIYL